MSRWKAASIHLSISCVIATLAATLVFVIWYPAPYSDAAGGDKLILVLLCVDLTIGPLLTLIVYRHGKRGMKFDLAVIAMLQLGALSYGLSVVAHARPAFIVAAIDRLMIVSADALEDVDLAAAPQPAWQRRSWFGPQLVAAPPPDDIESHNDLAFSGGAGKDIERFPKYYAPYSEHVGELLARSRTMDDENRSTSARENLASWLVKHGRSSKDTRWLPIVGRGGDFTAIIDAEDARILDVLAIDPW